MPSTVNGFLLQKDMETVFPFYIDYYHTQYDTPDTYNDAVMKFNIQYYGAMAMYIDQTPALYLDFTAQTDRLLAAVSEETMAQAGADVVAYRAALAQFSAAASAMKDKVVSLNADYAQAREAGDEQKMAELEQIAQKLEDAQTDIDEAIEMFTHAAQLIRELNGRLDDAEKRVNDVITGEDEK